MSKKKNSPDRKAAQIERELRGANAELSHARKQFGLLVALIIVVIAVFEILLFKGVLPLSSGQVVLGGVVAMLIVAVPSVRVGRRLSDAKEKVKNLERKLYSVK